MSVQTPRDPASRRDGASADAAAVSMHAVTRDAVDAAVASSCGPLHRANEDSHSVPAADSTLYVVADGVGGGAMASTASRELVAQLHTALDRKPVAADAVRRALLDADRRIADLIAERTASAGAATVALCCRAGESPADWLIAWVGDCRIYRVGAAAAPAELLSADDTYGRLREPPPAGGSTDDPARMVGNGAVGEPNTRAVALRPGEMLALCSDGVHKHLAPQDIADLLRGDAALEDRCKRLVAAARARGSRDDATVLAVARLPKRAGRDGRWTLAALLLALAIAGGWRWMAARDSDSRDDPPAAEPAASPDSAASSAATPLAPSMHLEAASMPAASASAPAAPASVQRIRP